jgi:hypothetical protein
MYRYFGRRAGEDQPASSGINGAKSRHVAKGRAIRLLILAVEQNALPQDYRSSAFSKPVPSFRTTDG